MIFRTKLRRRRSGKIFRRRDSFLRIGSRGRKRKANFFWISCRVRRPTGSGGHRGNASRSCLDAERLLRQSSRRLSSRYTENNENYSVTGANTFFWEFLS